MKKKSYHQLAHELVDELNGYYDHGGKFSLYMESGIYTIKYDNGQYTKALNSGMTAKQCFHELQTLRSFIEVTA